MQLLVSVVSEVEIRAAIRGGADIIDVKNPSEGSLGASFPGVIGRIRELTPTAIPVSAAVGDMPHLPGTAALAALGAAMCGVQYVKVGLFGSRRPQDAVFLLSEVSRAVHAYDPDIMVIATAFADAHKVGALPPDALPDASAEAGADGCMLDTAVKGEGTLLTNLAEGQLRSFVAQCRRLGLLCALAGSLGEADIPQICELGADIVGFRSAVCRGDRASGRVTASKVERLKRLIGEYVSPASVLC